MLKHRKQKQKQLVALSLFLLTLQIREMIIVASSHVSSFQCLMPRLYIYMNVIDFSIFYRMNIIVLTLDEWLLRFFEKSLMKNKNGETIDQESFYSKNK